MSKQFTAEETQSWLNKIPKKGVGVKALIRSEHGEVLVLKARGKGWQLPGGTVDQNESPQDALVRELKEELDLDIPEHSLTLQGIAYRPDYDHIIIFYRCNVVLDATLPFRTQPQEVEQYTFVPIAKLATLLDNNYKQVLEDYSTTQAR